MKGHFNGVRAKGDVGLVNKCYSPVPDTSIPSE